MSNIQDVLGRSSAITGSERPDSIQKLNRPANDGVVSDFEKILNKDKSDKVELQVSTHAHKRLEERNIGLDSNEYLKLKEAAMKLKNKGGHDSLIITSKAAYIVDLDRNTIVTAIDKESIGENVFTKIDSTMIIN